MNSDVKHFSWLKLSILICSVICIASAGSHLITRWIKIKTKSGGYQNYGDTNKEINIRLYGSSIAYSGIDWLRVTEELGSPIECWASLGSTPSVWEWSPLPSKSVNRIFILLSAHDLVENILSEFRADYVPINRTISDLQNVKTDWDYKKKVLEQYPMKAVRVLFPSFGRSDGIMTGVRDQLVKKFKRKKAKEVDKVVKLNALGSNHDERLSDWDPGRIARRMALIRAACTKGVFFSGLKRMALFRLIKNLDGIGEVTIVVAPVSPLYQKEFITANVKKDFENELNYYQSSFPNMEIIRLDQLSQLQDNSLFSDFVHANSFGKKIGTDALLAHLKNNRRN